MLKSECQKGMKVIFGNGSANALLTLGEIVKCNPKCAKVKQLQQRGNNPIGTIWSAPYELLTPADEKRQSALKAPLQYNPLMPYEDVMIVKAIDAVYNKLSPENLTCDGELADHIVRDKTRKLNVKLKRLFTVLGREVDELDAHRFVKDMEKSTREVG